MQNIIHLSIQLDMKSHSLSFHLPQGHLHQVLILLQFIFCFFLFPFCHVFFFNAHHFIILSDLPRLFNLKSPLTSTIFIYLKLRNQDTPLQSREKKSSSTHQNTDTSFFNQQTSTSQTSSLTHWEKPPQ